MTEAGQVFTWQPPNDPPSPSRIVFPLSIPPLSLPSSTALPTSSSSSSTPSASASSQPRFIVRNAVTTDAHIMLSTYPDIFVGDILLLYIILLLLSFHSFYFFYFLLLFIVFERSKEIQAASTTTNIPLQLLPPTPPHPLLLFPPLLLPPRSSGGCQSKEPFPSRRPTLIQLLPLVVRYRIANGSERGEKKTKGEVETNDDFNSMYACSFARRGSFNLFSRFLCSLCIYAIL